jgi:hypothetical protein
MKIIKVIKLTRQSKVLTEQEKRELIRKGLIESIINSILGIIKLPFIILGILFATLEIIFNGLAEIFDFGEGVTYDFCEGIDNHLQISLTNGQARDKLIKEIRENKIKKI